MTGLQFNDIKALRPPQGVFLPSRRPLGRHREGRLSVQRVLKPFGSGQIQCASERFVGWN